MKPALVVFLKECRDSLRDRRTLINALLIGPIIGPLIFIIILRLSIASYVSPSASTHLSSASQKIGVSAVVIGSEYAPQLILALRERGLMALPAVADIEIAVKNQQVDLAIRIKDSYKSAWSSEQPANVELIYDSSRREINSKAQQIRLMLEDYSRQTSASRLISHGVSPALANPVLVTTNDQATSQARGAMLFAMLPYFLVLSCLLGGMWLAIDSTAGERERQSLEPLLINPVSRTQLLFGKILATSVAGLCSLSLSLVVFLVAGWLLPIGNLGMTSGITPAFLAEVIPVMLPFLLLLVMLQIYVSINSKSIREAQTYLGLLQMVPIIPSLILSAVSVRPQLWMYAIPLLGQQISIAKLLRGEDIPFLVLTISAVVTLLAAFAVFVLVRRNYESERVAIST